jgi:mannose-6-phosphate isomerase-like protein (cupin superfamily)
VGLKTSSRVFQIGLAEALTKGPPPPGNLAVPIFLHGSLVVELYTPVGHDPQRPHTRDEVYFVARGKGFLFDGERRHAVEAGSLLFVPAGHVHRFEDFSSDFVVWVVFYGPEGGEARARWVRSHEPFRGRPVELGRGISKRTSGWSGSLGPG